MTLTHYGTREWLSFLIAAAIGVVVGAILVHVHAPTGVTIIVVCALLGFCGAAFFRDPHRHVPADPTVIVAPADGVVRDVEEVDFDAGDLFGGGKVRRIGIFLSVLDVHLNRAPCAFMIETKIYRQGTFHDARDPRASTENESMLIGGAAEVGNVNFPVAVKQISGAIAKRIVCGAMINTLLEKGERYGMIKFGSRTELFLPIRDDLRITVQVGDVVRAGSTVVAKLNDESGGHEKV